MNKTKAARITYRIENPDILAEDKISEAMKYLHSEAVSIGQDLGCNWTVTTPHLYHEQEVGARIRECMNGEKHSCTADNNERHVPPAPLTHMPIQHKDRVIRILPRRVWMFKIASRCRENEVFEAQIGLAKFPSYIELAGKKRKIDALIDYPLVPWRFARKEDTQDALEVGEEYFLAVHTGIVSLLDTFTEMGMLAYCDDTTGYYNHGDKKQLLRVAQNHANYIQMLKYYLCLNQGDTPAEDSGRLIDAVGRAERIRARTAANRITSHIQNTKNTDSQATPCKNNKDTRQKGRYNGSSFSSKL